VTSLCEAVRGVLLDRVCHQGPIELSEANERSRGAPVRLLGQTSFWAARLEDQHFLPILAEISADRSLRKLPDYLIFGEPEVEPIRANDVALRVMICELKSGAAGAAAAKRQVQLGKLLAEYLVRLAAYQLGQAEVPRVYPCGLIVSPQFPVNLRPKGSMRPGKIDYPHTYDKLSAMRVYEIPPGGEIHLESFF
jgi:hypothetical protein